MWIYCEGKRIKEKDKMDLSVHAYAYHPITCEVQSSRSGVKGHHQVQRKLQVLGQLGLYENLSQIQNK